jgi:hypothetical protein
MGGWVEGTDGVDGGGGGEFGGCKRWGGGVGLMDGLMNGGGEGGGGIDRWIGRMSGWVVEVVASLWVSIDRIDPNPTYSLGRSVC